MSRTSRKTSRTGYYHVIARGIGRQILFEEGDDYRRYIRLLQQYSPESGVDICAYCLMDNHIHLLLNDKENQLALFMKKINVSYAGYFNRKYGRTGHLFQGRYFSEAVENERYLVVVFWYILNNPGKAGICLPSAYPWSSYSAVENGSSFVNYEVMLSVFGCRQNLLDFLKSSEGEELPILEGRRYTEEWAVKKICDELRVESSTALQHMERKERDDALRRLKKLGLSVRQIERLTGINRNVVQRA